MFVVALVTTMSGMPAVARMPAVIGVPTVFRMFAVTVLRGLRTSTVMVAMDLCFVLWHLEPPVATLYPLRVASNNAASVSFPLRRDSLAARLAGQPAHPVIVSVLGSSPRNHDVLSITSQRPQRTDDHRGFSETTSPTGGYRHAFGETGRGLHTHHGVPVERLQVVSPGIRARTAHTSDDIVEQIFHAGPFRIQVHARP
jgi:hypothetical protein